jgi:hypothetical protein
MWTGRRPWRGVSGGLRALGGSNCVAPRVWCGARGAGGAGLAPGPAPPRQQRGGGPGRVEGAPGIRRPPAAPAPTLGRRLSLVAVAESRRQRGCKIGASQRVVGPPRAPTAAMAPTVSKVTQKSFYDLSKKELKTRVEGKLSDTDVKARAATLRCCALARRALARPRRPPPPPRGAGRPPRGPRPAPPRRVPPAGPPTQRQRRPGQPPRARRRRCRRCCVPQAPRPPPSPVAPPPVRPQHLGQHRPRRRGPRQRALQAGIRCQAAGERFGRGVRVGMGAVGATEGRARAAAACAAEQQLRRRARCGVRGGGWRLEAAAAGAARSRSRAPQSQRPRRRAGPRILADSTPLPASPPQDLAFQYTHKGDGATLKVRQVVPGMKWEVVPTPVIEVGGVEWGGGGMGWGRVGRGGEAEGVEEPAPPPIAARAPLIPHPPRTRAPPAPFPPSCPPSSSTWTSGRTP